MRITGIGNTFRMGVGTTDGGSCRMQLRWKSGATLVSTGERKMDSGERESGHGGGELRLEYVERI